MNRDENVMQSRLDETNDLPELPDEPRWIEARGMFLAGCGRFLQHGAATVIRNEHPDGGLVVVVRPSTSADLQALLAEALSDRPGRSVICMTDDDAIVGPLLSGWKREVASLYQLPSDDRLSPPDESVRTLSPDDPLDHLPTDLHDEIRSAVSERSVFTAFTNDLAVSFAYSFWVTERHFDISIDTAPAYRRCGLAQLAVSELIRHERAQGREPVWGAMDSNVASHRLAERLGFELVDRVIFYSQIEATG